jgi:hypothetical protein
MHTRPKPSQVRAQPQSLQGRGGAQPRAATRPPRSRFLCVYV